MSDSDHPLQQKSKTSVSPDSVSPYPTKKKGYPAYPTKTSSSDYKYSSKKAAESQVLDERRSGFSPECHCFTLIGAAIIVLFTSLFAQRLYEVFVETDEIKIIRVYSKETHRRATTYISENIDCSILMKQLQLKSVENNEIIFHGLACLYLNEPHSFAPDSANTVLIHWQQSRDALARNNAKDRNCDKNCQKSIHMRTSNSNCSIYDIQIYGYAAANLDSNYNITSLQDRLFIDLDKIFKNEENYQRVFSNFARFIDETPHPFPSIHKLIAQYEVNHHKNQKPKFNRVFQISPLFQSFMKHYGKDITKWNEIAINSVEKEDIKEGIKLNLTLEVAREVLQMYFYNRKPKGDTFDEKNFIRMAGKQNSRTEFLISWPVGNTCSHFVAFIIKTVYSAMQNLEFKNNDQKEAKFYLYFLVAQRIAYEYFPNTREWNNDNSLPSLIDHINDTRKILESLGTAKKYNRIEKNKLVTRPKADRVSTLMSWSEVHGESFICIINSALKKPFQSKYVSGTSNNELFPRFIRNGLESAPFTSSASIIILDVPQNNNLTRTPKILASASGSLRTVEAVAFPVLRYLLFDESPGEAVFAPTAYVSLRDGSFRCEKNRETKYDNTKLKDTLFYKTLVKVFEIECKDVDAASFEEIDRSSYMIARDTEKLTNDLHTYMKSAVDERSKNFNYATGY